MLRAISGFFSEDLSIDLGTANTIIYVRDKAKQHGRQNQIEGRLKKESNIIVIEDLISTGKSSINAIKVIEASGAKVNGLISIFTYGFFDVSLFVQFVRGLLMASEWDIDEPSSPRTANGIWLSSCTFLRLGIFNGKP